MAKHGRKKAVRSATALTGSYWQTLGDRHLKLAVEYERSLRALWFLTLRDKPGTTHEPFRGEDCKLTDPDGTVTFRQIKKRDVAKPWRLSDTKFKTFIHGALNEVTNNTNVVYEFYTNGKIQSELVEVTGRGTILRAEHSEISPLLADRDAGICSRVLFFENYEHTDFGYLEARVRIVLEAMVCADNPDAHTLAIVNVEEIAVLAHKLLASEPLLVSMGKVGWQEVDACIGYESYLARVRARLLGGQALLPVGQLDALDTQLPEDALDALRAIREGRSIPREPIEGEILQDIRMWLAAPMSASIRGAVVLGVHGSGRTHVLIRLLEQLAIEPGLQLFVASSMDPDPLLVSPALGMQRKNPLVLLIDDASEEWIHILSVPSGYFSRVYFVATTTSPKAAPDLDYLARQRGAEIRLIELPQSPSSEEVTALARVLRPVLPAATELAAATHTNIRGAVEVLTNQGSRALVGGFGELHNDDRDVVPPILACSAMGVPIPRALLERCIGRALPHALVAHFVAVRKRSADLIIYESSAGAAKLLDELLGGARDHIRYHLGELICNVDPTQIEHRRFARHLLGALWAHDQEAALTLLRDRKRQFLPILEQEGVYALAFSWLPMVGGTNDDLFKACFRPLTRNPSTAAEFALFLRYYGVAEAAKILYQQLKTRTDWDGWLLTEVGKMIVRLPTTEQREVGRRYTQMLFDLPARMFFQASTMCNAFTTMMKLLAEHGVPYDRIRAVNLVNQLFLFRAADGLPVASNWVEAYLRLCDRALRQERNGLSLDIVRYLVGDCLNREHAKMVAQVRERYHQLRQKEARARFDGILRVGLDLFEDVTDFRRLLGEVNVPSNILRLVTTWGTPEDKDKIVASFVVYVEGIADKVPLDRMFSFVASGFRLLGSSGSPELRRRFVTAILPWLLERWAVPQTEQGAVAFYVLGQCAGGVFDDDHVIGRCCELLTENIFDPDAGLAGWNDVLRHLCRLANTLYVIVGSVPWPPLSEWKKNTLVSYLGSVSAAHVPGCAMEFATRLWERWHTTRWASLDLAYAISSLGLTKEASALVEPLRDIPNHRVAALSAMAVVELRRGRRPEAYDAMRMSVQVGDTTGHHVSPRQAYVMHKAFELLGEPGLGPLHGICAALVHDSRLPLKTVKQQTNGVVLD